MSIIQRTSPAGEAARLSIQDQSPLDWKCAYSERGSKMVKIKRGMGGRIDAMIAGLCLWLLIDDP